MATKKKVTPRKTNKTTEALAKSGDTLDTGPAFKQFQGAEKMSVDAMKMAVKEIDEIQSTPDLPKRWRSDRGPLTIASPGNIVEDPSYIPERVTTRDGIERHVSNHRIIDGQAVILTKDSQMKYRWCRNDGRKIPLHQRRGYVYEKYSQTFADTGLFVQGPGDTIKNGDLILMKIYMDAWEKMRTEKKNLQAALEGAIGGELFQAGQDQGVPTFKDNIKTGTREFYT